MIISFGNKETEKIYEGKQVKNNKIMKRLPYVRPGEILQEEFLSPMGITAYRLSKETGMSQTRVSQIIKGQRRITADTAIRFSRFFGNSVKF